MKTTIIILLFSTIILAQVLPYGQEFRVSSYTESQQSRTSICSLCDGGFVICWTSYGQDGSGCGVYARLYAGNGQPVGSEFQVNTYTNKYQQDAAICGLSDGGFMICWTSYGQDSSGYGIYAQRYAADGQIIGSEFQVNSYIQNRQSNPAICGLSDNGFVICWNSNGQDGSGWGVYAQCYDGNGQPDGSEFRVNSYTYDDQWVPSICRLKDGGFVICWRSKGQDGDDYGIYAQRYTENNQTVGDEFQVNSYTQYWQDSPSICTLNDGGFVICWSSYGQNGSHSGIYAQRYSGNGQSISSEFQVNTYTQDHQSTPAISGLNDGGFSICWTTEHMDAPWSVYAQRYAENGQPVGSEFRINSYTQGTKHNSATCGLSDGDFVICWQSYGQDGSNWGIYAKRLPQHPLHHELHVFTLQEPQIDKTIYISTPTLTWQPASDMIVAYPWELEYAVYYDTLADFNTAKVTSVGLDTSLTLSDLKLGKTWFWKVLAKTYYGDEMWSDVSAFFISHTASVQNISNPEQFSISQNYPNPFNPSTTIQFKLPEPGTVSLKIFDIQGRTVYDSGTEFLAAGQHSRMWDGVNTAGEQVAAGVYLYRVEYQSQSGQKQVMMKKMSLVR